MKMDKWEVVIGKIKKIKGEEIHIKHYEQSNQEFSSIPYNRYMQNTTNDRRKNICTIVAKQKNIFNIPAGLTKESRRIRNDVMKFKNKYCYNAFKEFLTNQTEGKDTA